MKFLQTHETWLETTCFRRRQEKTGLGENGKPVITNKQKLDSMMMNHWLLVTFVQKHVFITFILARQYITPSSRLTPWHSFARKPGGFRLRNACLTTERTSRLPTSLLHRWTAFLNVSLGILNNNNMGTRIRKWVSSHFLFWSFSPNVCNGR